MFPSDLNALAAREVAADLQRAADAYRRARAVSAASDQRPAVRGGWLSHLRPATEAVAPAAPGAVTIRLSRADDAPALAELASLDESRLPRGPVLLAEVEGIPRAALPLAGGSPISDPFYPSAGLVSLLAVRAAQLSDERPGEADRPRSAGHSARLHVAPGR